ncbi:recombinase family protein [Streptomyces sp. NPDC088554]|uniref:recombinase family protein n=1 Tax=Streptomyces sp. NPDC088554 TaxID=3365865 RepID=UPI00382101F3
MLSLQHSPARAGKPTRRPDGRGLRPDLLREDQHPHQSAARVRQGPGLRPHHQESRPPPGRHLHRPEMKRLGRGATELLTIAEDLRTADIQLELLTGPLQGVYDPSGHGAALFAFFAGMAESEREYIREKSLEGQASAHERDATAAGPRS